MAISTSLLPAMDQIFNLTLDGTGLGEVGPVHTTFGWATTRIQCSDPGIIFKCGPAGIDPTGGVILNSGHEYMDFADGQYLAFSGPVGATVQVVVMEMVD